MNNQKRERKIKWGSIAYFAVLVFLAVVALFPIYMMLQTSFKAQVDIMSSEPTWVFTPTTDNYEVVVFGQKFDRYLTNSVIVGLVTTFLTLFTAGLASYALARMQFPGRGLLAHSTLLIRMVPTRERMSFLLIQGHAKPFALDPGAATRPPAAERLPWGIAG